MSAVLARLRALSPRAILALGWGMLAIYAYPGYMSFDSVYQLLEARAGVFSDGHPPAMGLMWRFVDGIVPGPFGMLLVQTTCFLLGTYLLCKRWMAPRAAALCASGLLLFPPVSAVMAVIWKDSQMAAFLVLGTALLLSPRRGVRFAGLGCFALATAMRHNALAMTLPLVFFLFAWNERQRWFKRYPIAIAAWLVITLAANTLNSALTTTRWHIWHQSLALLDITATLRYADDVPEVELADVLAGTTVIPTEGFQALARSDYPANMSPIDGLWFVTKRMFAIPNTVSELARASTPANREATVRAWKHIVPAHPAAYLTYRWEMFRTLVQLYDGEKPAAVYVWFTDVLDPSGSAAKLGYNAVPGGIQTSLREAMVWVAGTWLFRPYLYMFLGLALLALAWRDVALRALVASGLVGEAALFFLTPTGDYRYSFWMVVATTLGLIAVVARRTAAFRSGGGTR